MSKPMHAEHKMIEMMPWPRTIEVCRRCRRGIVMYRGAGISPVRTPEHTFPLCGVCSNDEPGEPYGLKAELA